MCRRTAGQEDICIVKNNALIRRVCLESRQKLISTSDVKSGDTAKEEIALTEYILFYDLNCLIC